MYRNSTNNSRNSSRCGWHSRITVNGKRMYLGSFSTEKEAAVAYHLATRKYGKAPPHLKKGAFSFSSDNDIEEAANNTKPSAKPTDVIDVDAKPSSDLKQQNRLAGMKMLFTLFEATADTVAEGDSKKFTETLRAIYEGHVDDMLEAYFSSSTAQPMFMKAVVEIFGSK